MKKYKAIIFDLDGTLLNTLDDLADSVNYALEQMAYPKRTLEEVRTFVGNGVKNLVIRAVPQTTCNDMMEETLSIFKEHYSGNMLNKTRPYDGILELLAELKNQGYQMAIVSNKFDDAVKNLNNIFFSEFIQVAIGESSSVAKKPSPDTCLKAMEELGVKAEDCLYVGDSDVDIQTAANSGVESISVTWGFRDEDFLRANGATEIIHKPMELLNHLS